MGYKFQFVTLAGFHALNLSMFELARGYQETGMTAYSRLQEKNLSREASHGYEAVKHQRFVGTGYFDVLHEGDRRGGLASTTALAGSTEAEQFAGTTHRGQSQHGPNPACQPILGECPSVPMVSESLLFKRRCCCLQATRRYGSNPKNGYPIRRADEYLAIHDRRGHVLVAIAELIPSAAGLVAVIELVSVAAL